MNVKVINIITGCLLSWAASSLASPHGLPHPITVTTHLFIPAISKSIELVMDDREHRLSWNPKTETFRDYNIVAYAKRKPNIGGDINYNLRIRYIGHVCSPEYKPALENNGIAFVSIDGAGVTLPLDETQKIKEIMPSGVNSNRHVIDMKFVKTPRVKGTDVNCNGALILEASLGGI